MGIGRTGLLGVTVQCRAGRDSMNEPDTVAIPGQNLVEITASVRTRKLLFVILELCVQVGCTTVCIA